jgi:hypothetical protein
MTPIFHQGQYLPRVSGGKNTELISQLIYFIRVTIYLAALHHNITRVTIYPARFTACFGLFQGHFSPEALELLP